GAQGRQALAGGGAPLDINETAVTNPIRARYTGMRTAIGVNLAGFIALIVLAGCGSAPVARSASSPVAQVSTSPAASPSANPTAAITASPAAAKASTCQTFEPLPGLCVGLVGRVPTAQEYGDMKAAGIPAVEQALGYKDWSTCSSGEVCFKTAPATSVMV